MTRSTRITASFGERPIDPGLPGDLMVSTWKISAARWGWKPAGNCRPDAVRQRQVGNPCRPDSSGRLLQRSCQVTGVFIGFQPCPGLTFLPERHALHSCILGIPRIAFVARISLAVWVQPRNMELTRQVHIDLLNYIVLALLRISDGNLGPDWWSPDMATLHRMVELGSPQPGFTHARAP